MTRRVVKEPISGWLNNADGTHKVLDGRIFNYACDQHLGNCPYGKPGDRLWVREAHALDGDRVFFRAGHPEGEGSGPRVDVKWRPSIHMPRWASRITLEVIGVRVERLQQISEADCVAEGIGISSKERRSDQCYGIYEYRMPDGKTHFNDSAYDLYRALWKGINGDGSWEAKPWVWVVEFQRLEAKESE